MNILIAIVALCLVAAPLALVARWFVDRGYGGLGALVNPGGSDGWWRTTMPWPQGVQEEDGVQWHIRDADVAIAAAPAGDVTLEQVGDDYAIAPTHPKTRIGLRPPSSR
jgi:hypothetical protein